MPDVKRGSALLGLLAVLGLCLGAVDLTVGPTYVVYVVAESEDLIQRLRIGPEGARVEQSAGIGDLLMDIDGPHGIAVDPAREFLYVSTGHGIEGGSLWKVAVGPDTTVAPPLLLGRFPATLDVTPDGLFALVANFNLHGEMTPSSISVVYLPDFVEVARTETCTMPHGSRVSPDGRRHYSVCMMDDQLVELETRTFKVARRFSVADRQEGPLDADDAGHHAVRREDRGTGHDYVPSCSPTWADTDPTGRTLYVACNKSDHVLEVDVDRWTVTRRFATGRGPYNLEVSPDGRILVVTLKQGSGVELIDLDRGSTTSRVATSVDLAHGVTISPDSRYAFVSVEGIGAEPGRVDVVDLRRGERVESVVVGLQAAGVTFFDMQPAPR